MFWLAMLLTLLACWLVYNPVTGNVIRTQNARFDEHWRDSLLASSSLPLGETAVDDADEEESQDDDPASTRGRHPLRGRTAIVILL